MTELAPGITSDPNVMSGAACVAGTRIPTKEIAGYFCKHSLKWIAGVYVLTIAQVEEAMRYELLLRLPVSKGGLKPARRSAKKAKA